MLRISRTLTVALAGNHSPTTILARHNARKCHGSVTRSCHSPNTERASCPLIMTAAHRPAETSVSPSLVEAIERFEGVPLEETRSAALLDRTDTKYILPVERISEVLAGCASTYQVVEVSGNRLCRYSTLYFDSDDLVFYRQHHD